MADDQVDISGMPDPPAGYAEQQSDPTAGMPSPEDQYRKFYFGGGLLNANGKPGPIEPIPKDALDEFIANPPSSDVAKNLKTGASALTGLPRVAAVYNPVTPVVAAVAGGIGALSGSLGAVAHNAIGRPDLASQDLETGRQRLRDWSSGVYKLAEYLPSKLATDKGNEAADTLNSIPQQIGKNINDNMVRPWAGDNAADTLGDIGQDIGTELPGFGAKGLALKGVKGVKAAAKAGSDFVKSEAASVNAPGDVPSEPLRPDTAPPVSAASLRATKNPIPPPEGTVAAERQRAAAPPVKAAAPAADTPTRDFSENAAAQPATPALPESDSALQDMSLSPDQRALVREGVAARRAAADSSSDTTQSPGDAQRGSVRLFNAPKDEGPQETATPEQQTERQAHLEALDKLSGGLLPTRRMSAISGDYNATGNDWQAAKVGNEAAQRQLASESDALHAATANVHNSLGSLSDDSVDPKTLEDRGRTVRGAIQAIEKHFNDATDDAYKGARAAHGEQPMPSFLTRAKGFLDDEANYMPDSFRKSAQARLNQLKTVGDNGADGDAPAAPGSVAAAEKFRQWLGKNRTLDNMHTVKQLVDHTDTDVSEHGGPGLFAAARNLRRHQFQMLEEPVGVKKLLTPSDSQGINHVIPEHKVMDYVNDLPREQHEHLMDVLRAGAHMSPELAESSAAAIREIQAHTISRLHDAATNDGGKWNARDFANAGARYARNAESTFKDRPDVRKNLKTISDAGNTLHMDKSYPGAVGQAVRSGVMGAAVKGAGAVASSLAHEIPVVGRMVGRGIEGMTEGATGEMAKKAAEKEFEKRTVDRNGKQRGSVQLFNDNPLNRKNEERTTFHGKDINPRNERNERVANQQMGGQRPLTDEQNDVIGRLMGGKQRGAVGDLSQRDAVNHEVEDAPSLGLRYHSYSTPHGGGLDVREVPGLDVRKAYRATQPADQRGKGWGTRTLQRAVDDAHAAGQKFQSDSQVSESQAGAYKNLKALGYDVKAKPYDNVQGELKAHGDHVFEVGPQKKAGVPSNQRGAVGDLQLAAKLKNQRGSVRVMNGKEEYQANKDLENFVHKQAPAHRVDENGPSSWEELQARRGEKVMPINPHGSEGSIYSDPKTNIAFRAWHDKLHLDLNAGFDHEGELKVAQEHLRQAKAAGLSEESQRALWADTWETFKHHEDHGDFPSKPREFVAQQMKNKFPGDKSEDGKGSTLNVGLHQGQEGDEGFRKMSKQEAQKAVESTGAKVTKSTVLTPKQHGVSEPTSVMSTDRPLNNKEMQGVLAKTKQSAIPQRTDAGEESMHVAPGHEQTAKEQGWDKFNPDYFREHSGQTATDAQANPKNIHPNSTVKDAKRSAYPGIYDDPMDVVTRAETVPESPHLKEIFGTTRKQMHDAVIKQGDVPPKTPMPGMAAKGKGSAHAQQVTTPENAERVRNIISALKEAAPDAYHGMVSWYHMEPMYQSIKKILGGDADRAGDVFHKLNTYTALSSPMSSVEPEIRRGTAAATAAAEGKFDQFKKFGGLPADKVPKSATALKNLELGFEGHAFHGTAQAPAMSRFNETGQEANAPKTGAYRRASDAPSRPGSDYQNTVLVGDSHFSRGVGLADVRGAKAYDGSIDGTELKTVHPWYHENVAKPLGIPATSAQAAQWAAMSHDTGVETAIGSPKLEIWADQIAAAAKKAGVEPKVMWERIVKRLAK